MTTTTTKSDYTVNEGDESVTTNLFSYWKGPCSWWLIRLRTIDIYRRRIGHCTHISAAVADVQWTLVFH